MTKILLVDDDVQIAELIDVYVVTEHSPSPNY